MFLLIRKPLICFSAALQTFTYSPRLTLNFVRKAMFFSLVKEEQDLYQMAEIVLLMSTVTGG
jgi:hypothetical protein